MNYRKLHSTLIVLIIAAAAACVPVQADPAVPTLVPTIVIPTPTQTRTPFREQSPTTIPSPTLIPSPTATETPVVTPTPSPVVLIGAGDVAFCGDAPEYQGDEQTAALIESQLALYPNATVFIPGDVVYGEGKMVELMNCFGPSWGRFKDRIRPVPGNHDYTTAGAAPYYEYFGAAAGEPGKGYYSYDLGDWHIVGLNSNCNDVACGPDSQQAAWFLEDLKSNSKTCTLAYWHHPRFSSGIAGGSGAVKTFWRTAVDNGVDVVVNGHDHDYERFDPIDKDGKASPDGVRLFIVGTGGGVLRDFGEIKPNSEVRIDHTHGVIVFKLFPDSYEWTFLSADGQDVSDSGSGVCH